MKKIRWQLKWYNLDDCESGNAFLFDGTLEEVTEKCESMKTEDTDYDFEFYCDLD